MIEQKEGKKGFSGLQVLGIVLLVMIVTVAGTLFAAKMYLFPKPFEPVVLSEQEQQQLAAKLDHLEMSPPGKAPPRAGIDPPRDYTDDGRVQPLPYSEEGATREISFTEREVLLWDGLCYNP